MMWSKARSGLVLALATFLVPADSEAQGPGPNVPSSTGATVDGSARVAPATALVERILSGEGDAGAWRLLADALERGSPSDQARGPGPAPRLAAALADSLDGGAATAMARPIEPPARSREGSWLAGVAGVVTNAAAVVARMTPRSLVPSRATVVLVATAVAILVATFTVARLLLGSTPRGPARWRRSRSARSSRRRGAATTCRDAARLEARLRSRRALS